jgi:hypothetical protein
MSIEAILGDPTGTARRLLSLCEHLAAGPTSNDRNPFLPDWGERGRG